MVSTKAPATIASYDKSMVLKQLTDAREAVESAIDTWEDSLNKWRDTVVERFSKAVEQFDPSEGSGFSHFPPMHQFEPPRKPDACRDYRVQDLNRTIARIEMMVSDLDGSIKLRLNDPLWAYINYASCI